MNKEEKENTIKMVKESSNAIAQMYSFILIGIAIPFIIIWFFH